MNNRRLVAMMIALLLAISTVTAASATSTVNRSKAKGAFKIALVIGPAETVSTSTTTNGEKMLSGPVAACKMPSATNTNMGLNACNYHVEVHVVTRAGKTVMNAAVGILLQNKKSRKLIYVPVSRMESSTTGIKDMHFGNNVHAPAATYNVLVTVNKTKVTFKNVRLTP
jgi:hypothetical protein